MDEETTPLAQALELDVKEPPYLKTPTELAQILVDHQEWLDTRGKTGTLNQLDWYAFAHLDLANGNLKQALLKEANFKGANLTGATLRESGLSGAQFYQANLLRADLRDADLRESDLSGAENLKVSQLGGSDLTDAKLPEVLSKFEDLDNIAEASKNAAHVFITMLAACVLSWLTVATTTDVGLITNTPTSTLPVIGTALPIVGFYVAAPILLLAVYVYLHISLARLWEGLGALPAVFPDGRRLDQVAYPWFLNGLACLYFRRLKDKNRRPPFALSQFFLSLLLTWGLVPLTIGLLWLRYLTRQDWPVTLENILLLALAGGFGLRSFLLARRILKGRKCRSQGADIGSAAASILLFLLLFIFAFGSIFAVKEPPYGIEEVPSIWVTASSGSAKPEVPNQIKMQLPNFLNFLWFLPWEIRAAGLRRAIPCVSGYLPLPFGPFANLVEVDVSTKPARWTGDEKELVLVKGAPLHSRNLRYALADGTFLVKADLRNADLTGAFLGYADLRLARLHGANLQGANFQEAKLQGANLQVANLQRAFLFGVNLQGAFLRGANLQRADLQDADLQEAKLEGANLQGARLGETNLQGAKLERAHFQEAVLEGTKLKGADLRDAELQGAKLSGIKGLTKKQVKAARYWVLAFYDPPLLKMLGLPDDHNNRIGKKDLSKYNLQGAKLEKADFWGTDLHEADLRGANLVEANLQGADLRGANLQGAKLWGTNLQGAKLYGAKGLTKKQVKAARCWVLAFYDPPLLKILGLPEDHNIWIGKKDLSKYNLQGVKLEEADLQGTDLHEANLHEANLNKANLQGANLQGADLRGADLRGAKLLGVEGLTEEQVKSARCWVLAFYDPPTLKMLGLPEDHNDRIEKQDLSNYNLQEADLRWARLRDANFQGADLRRADLRGANLSDAKNLTQEQLDSAITNDYTIPPRNLTLKKTEKE